MNNKYYSDDNFFNKIIDEYFNKNGGWIKITDRNNTCENNKCKNIAFHHMDQQLCNTCTVSKGFLDTRQLGNKKLMYENLIKWNTKSGNDRKHLSYLPETFSFTQQNYNKLKNKFDNNKLWIIKPVQSSYQFGISIVYSYNEFVKALQKYKQVPEWVMQEYIYKPLLYNNKKFHFRVYAILLRTDDVFETYLYPKGYMYVADEVYKIGDIYDTEKHITTSCNNKEFPIEYDKYYGKNEFKSLILPQIRRIVHDTTKATYKHLMCANTGKGRLCYKMLGYDILPDVNKKLHLIESNTRIIGMASTDYRNSCKSKNPSLQTMEFKTELMTNILNLTLKQNNTNLLFERVLHIDLNYNWMRKYIGGIILLILLYYIYTNKFLV
jgi:hypothetical protein